MHSAETSFLVDLEGTEVVTEAQPDFGLQPKTWVITEKLGEVSLFMSETDINEGFAPGFAAGKFLCHLKDDSTSEQGFMRIYCQIPIPGTEWKTPTARATQAAPSIELDELLAFKSFMKNSCTAVPRLLGYQEGRQADDGKVPGGFITTIVWEKVPGVPLSQIPFWNLDVNQRDSIRQEFQRAYEQIAQCGYEPWPPTFSKLIYDESTGKIHISGFGLAVPAGNIQWKKSAFVMYGLAKVKQPPRTDWYDHEEEWEY
ncbi:hypothetical protein N7535_002840 [Penicillium sp. DV-2018c]|nr:hypothetical protein N7461_001476 [Penicillium sp. DV-2018c]KAJ5575914.1 hypothetical protein N7535_002840 [Penicillium sp. DV-2018c]